MLVTVIKSKRSSHCSITMRRRLNRQVCKTFTLKEVAHLANIRKRFMFKQSFPPDSFRRVLHPSNSTLVALCIKNSVLFLLFFKKKWEGGCYLYIKYVSEHFFKGFYHMVLQILCIIDIHFL